MWIKSKKMVHKYTYGSRYMVVLVVDLDELEEVDAFSGNPCMVEALDA